MTKTPRALKAMSVVQAIDDGYEADPRESRAREYIGASSVGNPCDALLAFSLRGFPNKEPDPQLRRIFNLGHKMEDMVVADLKKYADVAVWEVDGLTGKQYSYEEFGGHIAAHADGHIEIDDELMILEIKSMNDGSWTKFVREGVKRSHPVYYAQLQMMMGMSGFQSAFFIALNKNNSKYHAEIVEFDPFEFSHIQHRVGLALSGEVKRIASDETDWRCRGCFKAPVCWGQIEAPKRCQTCAFSVPTGDGWWHCDKRDEPAPTEACDLWEQWSPKHKE